MPLPLSIDNVQCTQQPIIGDLIITRRVVYFFPHTNRESKENLKRPASIIAMFALATEYVASALSVTAVPGVLAAIHFVQHMLSRSLNRSKLRKQGLWQETDSSSSLQLRLDEYIIARKKERKLIEEFSGSLPLPERFEPDAIKRLTITFGGKLIVETRYDRIGFRVGLLRKRA